MKIIYPGTFDPVTLGHLDIIDRSSKLFDEVIVAVLVNTAKKTLFTSSQRVEMLKKLLYHYNNVKILEFSGLLVDLVKREEADAVVRGLRALSDYEYEMQIALLNRTIKKDVETLFMMSDSKYAHISSSLAKEVAFWGGELSSLVPDVVESELKNKFVGEYNGYSTTT